MTEEKKDMRVRDVIAHLQTLPQDLPARILVENALTGEQCLCRIEDIEIHETQDGEPNGHWNNKVVVLKAMQ